MSTIQSVDEEPLLNEIISQYEILVYYHTEIAPEAQLITNKQEKLKEVSKLIQDKSYMNNLNISRISLINLSKQEKYVCAILEKLAKITGKYFV
jgi:hypothetical protein